MKWWLKGFLIANVYMGTMILIYWFLSRKSFFELDCGEIALLLSVAAIFRHHIDAEEHNSKMHGS